MAPAVKGGIDCEFLYAVVRILEKKASVPDGRALDRSNVPNRGDWDDFRHCDAVYRSKCRGGSESQRGAAEERDIYLGGWVIRRGATASEKETHKGGLQH
jgi:hypothetical protein